MVDVINSMTGANAVDDDAFVVVFVWVVDVADVSAQS